VTEALANMLAERTAVTGHSTLCFWPITFWHKQHSYLIMFQIVAGTPGTAGTLFFFTTFAKYCLIAMQNYSEWCLHAYAINSMTVHYLIKQISFQANYKKNTQLSTILFMGHHSFICLAPFFPENANKIAPNWIKKKEEAWNKFVNYAKLPYLCYANNKHFQLSINVIPLNLICRYLNSIARFYCWVATVPILIAAKLL
jgi:hypothetical protein